MRSFLVLLLACLPQNPLVPPPPQPPQEPCVTHPCLEEQIRGSDDYLLAWAAFHARQQQDSVILARVPSAIRGLLPRDSQPLRLEQVSRNTYLALVALLHAAIATRQTLLPESLVLLAPVFPVQSLILAAQLPSPDRVPLLSGWYQQGSTDPALSSTAALLLAHTPPPGFAASIAQSTVATLDLLVVSPNSGEAGIVRLAGDVLSGFPPPGWLPLLDYILQENEPSPSAEFLVETGDIKRYTLAVPLYAAPTHSSTYPKPDFRHAVLSQLLNQPEPQMPWQTSTTAQITWSGFAKTRAALLHAIASERAALDQTVTTLVSRGLILPDEARTARPLLQVTLRDEREDRHPPLPRLRLADPRTTLTTPSFPARP